ncbi:MAG: hypothetical protein O7A08_14760 [SAR324 cluster bacterium]|nr:hypothetical protein [SAR324 cluster bacterium]MCZ6534210.1 hypothetical protein [SAR324 cluster bacterium]MCZ6558589.1 hypothetical protein [SAR324 cluster bacterium]MCZ6627920.1 hypothetical protein [SAR324 cluster bacterium]MCZ6645538.1 hypothetical protein [SAR324 cluster bacterium]
MKKAGVLLTVLAVSGLLFSSTSFAGGFGGCSGKKQTPIKKITQSVEKPAKSG